MTGFLRLVAALSCVWVIRIVKHIKSNRDVDTKSNHGRQYAVELES